MKYNSGSLLRAAVHATMLLAANISLTSLAGAQARSPGRVEGLVYDSVSRRPLRLATVQLLRIGSETDMRTTGADSAGRFRFDSVPDGEWMVGAWHTRLDSVGVRQLSRRTRVESGKRRDVLLAIPSSTTLIRRMCGDSTARNSLGLVFGTVRQADRNRTTRPGSVRAKWTETIISGKQIAEQIVGFDQPTTPDGEYVACGVPADSRFQVQASAGDDSSGVIEVQTGVASLYRLDLHVASTTRRVDTSVVRIEDSATVSTDTVLTPYLAGIGRVDGVVRRSGVPLPGALITLWGTGLEARSDNQGRFTLGRLPVGTHTLDVRVIGYTPLRQAIDIFPDEAASVVLQMEKGVTLDTMRIQAWANRDYGRFNEAEFLKRKRRGFGVFLSPEDLSRENPTTMSQLYARAQFVRVRWDIATGESITMGANEKRCVPVFVLDGVEIKDEEFFMLQRPDNLVALEIYRGSSAPAELAVPNPCGTIAAWTGKRVPAFRSK